MRKVGLFLLSTTLLPILALSGCGDLNTVLAADGSYRVAAMVGSSSLEESSLVRQGDALRPAFLSNITGDPDVIGLSIQLLDSGGAPLSEEIVYKLRSAGTSENADMEDDTLWVSRLDDTLPAFTVPEYLSPGFYTLYFKVLGMGGVLSDSRRSFYYLKDAVFSVGDIKSYPPGEDPTAAALLFPPSVNLLLDVPIDADARLDPYIVWTSKKTPIAEGYLSEGAQRLLWKTPSAEGFHEIRAEVYPERPGADGGPSIAVSPRRLPIAVSHKAPIPGPSGKMESYQRLYRFLGTLGDAVSSDGELRGPADRAPRWLPGKDAYGLAVGPSSAYGLPQALLPVDREGTAKGDLFLRFAVLGLGTVLKAEFQGSDTEETLILRVLSESDRIRIILAAPSGEKSMDLPLPEYPGTEFLDLALSLRIDAAGAFVSARTEDFDGSIDIPLAKALPHPGAGSFSLGLSAERDPGNLENEPLSPPSAERAEFVALFDEFALRFEK